MQKKDCIDPPLIFSGSIKKNLLVSLLFITILTLSIPSFASAITEDWSVRYNGPGNGADKAYALAVDPDGNVYVTGYSYSGTSYDYYTVKYDSSGAVQWEQLYNGPGNSTDVANAIAVDSSGNVFVTGYSTGSGTSTDYYTVKYSSSGAIQWEQRYNGPASGLDKATAIAVDSSGNVFVTGYSPNFSTLDDYATVKYNVNGIIQWTQRYNGPGNNNDRAIALAVDSSDNVYVTGYSYSATSYDYYTVKYDTGGAMQWEQRYNGPANDYDAANALAIDSSDNVYVTGYSYSSTSYDYYTVKYSSGGAIQWEQRYNGPADYYDAANALAIDSSDNVYVTGNSYAGTSYDYYTVKYDSGGAIQWEQRYNGPANNIDVSLAIAVDPAESVYVTGYSTSADASYDFYTIKYAIYYPLTASKAGTGSGTVTSDPAGIDCGSDCTEDYINTTTVILTAIPDTGSVFAGWSGDPDCSDGTVTINTAKNCTATFNTAQYTLDIFKSGTGSGTVTSDPSGIDCGIDCTEDYAYNTLVTLTATSDTGSAFAGWSGGGCSGTGTCQVTMTAAASVTAAFNSMHQLTTSVSPSDNGSITPDCSGICTYENGTVVVLTANEDNGYPFNSWTGCDSASTNTCTMTMDTDKSLTAVFEPCRYPARTSSYYYSFFQDAYDDAVDSDTIQGRDYMFTGDLVIDIDKAVTIEAGYDCSYTSINGGTIINGNMTINNGFVTISNGTLEIQ